MDNYTVNFDGVHQLLNSHQLCYIIDNTILSYLIDTSNIKKSVILFDDVYDIDNLNKNLKLINEDKYDIYLNKNVLGYFPKCSYDNIKDKKDYLYFMAILIGYMSEIIYNYGKYCENYDEDDYEDGDQCENCKKCILLDTNKKIDTVYTEKIDAYIGDDLVILCKNMIVMINKLSDIYNERIIKNDQLQAKRHGYELSQYLKILMKYNGADIFNFNLDKCNNCTFFIDILQLDPLSEDDMKQYINQNMNDDGITETLEDIEMKHLKFENEYKILTKDLSTDIDYENLFDNIKNVYVAMKTIKEYSENSFSCFDKLMKGL